MKSQPDLLWIDGIGALIVGVVVLIGSRWFCVWCGVPHSVLVFTGLVNLLYASYSIPLAMRSKRPANLILFLILANLMWLPVCFALAFMHRETLTALGTLLLVGEGIFVGGLACVEWQCRDRLQRA